MHLVLHSSIRAFAHMHAFMCIYSLFIYTYAGRCIFTNDQQSDIHTYFACNQVYVSRCFHIHTYMCIVARSHACAMYVFDICHIQICSCMCTCTCVHLLRVPNKLRCGRSFPLHIFVQIFIELPAVPIPSHYFGTCLVYLQVFGHPNMKQHSPSA